MAPVLLFFVCLVPLTTQAKECDTNITSLNGMLISPTPPQRKNTASEYTCRWTIQLKSTLEPRHVELRFLSFDITGRMPLCLEGNYLEIFLGCNSFKSIGRFCGQTSLPVIYSPDHCLKIEFRMSSLNVRASFTASYKQRLLSKAVSQSLTGCGKDHHSNVRHGNIFSPHWPLPYPRYVDCVWRVTMGSDFHLKLVFFDFDVRSSDQCDKADFVEVKSGGLGLHYGRSLTNSKECGTKDPFVLTVKGNSMFIQFKSDVITGNRGFMAGFVAYNIESATFQPEVLIMLSAMVLALFALAGKTVSQNLLRGKKLNRKCLYQMLRNSVQSKRCFPPKTVLPSETLLAESTVTSYCPQCACPQNRQCYALNSPWSRSEERLQSKAAKKAVKFDSSTKSDKDSVNLLTSSEDQRRI